MKVVACGVFEPELAQLANESANEIELVFLDAGLHSVPNTLRERAQAEIEAAAIEAKCDLFVTADQRLGSFTEIPIAVLRPEEPD